MKILFVSQEINKNKNIQNLKVDYITFDEYFSTLDKVNHLIYDFIIIELFGDDRNKIDYINKSKKQTNSLLVNIIYIFDNINTDLLIKEVSLDNFDYLMKPFSNEDFLNKVNSYINSKKNFYYNDYKMIVKGKLLKPLEHQWKQPLNLIATNLLNLEIKSELSKLTKNDVDKANEKIEFALHNISNDMSSLNKCFDSSECKTIFSIDEAYSKVLKFISPQANKNNISFTRKENFNDIKISNYENEFCLSLLMFLYIFMQYAIENKSLENDLPVEISFEEDINKFSINIVFHKEFCLSNLPNKFTFEFLVLKELLKKVDFTYKASLDNECTSIKIFYN